MEINTYDYMALHVRQLERRVENMERLIDMLLHQTLNNAQTQTSVPKGARSINELNELNELSELMSREDILSRKLNFNESSINLGDRSGTISGLGRESRECRESREGKGKETEGKGMEAGFETLTEPRTEKVVERREIKCHPIVINPIEIDPYKVHQNRQRFGI